MGDIVEMLRLRACSPEEYLEHNHGHSDCYLEREAADEIEQLRSDLQTVIAETQLLISLITAWADAEDAAWGTESGRLEEACDALRKAVGR